MKCPYQTKVIHKPEYTEVYEKKFAEDITVLKFAEDITEFCECVKSECPLYYISWEVEHCRRAESEGKE